MSDFNSFLKTEDALRPMAAWLKSGDELLSIAKQIIEAKESALSGTLSPGQSFRIKRRFVNVIRESEKSDIAFFLCYLFRFDEDATFPYQLILERRPDNTAIKRVRADLKSAQRYARTYERDYSLYLRVVDFRKATGASFDKALEAVAAGEDGPLGLLKIKPKSVSVAVAKRAFTRINSETAKSGYLQRRRGMMFSQTSLESIPPVPPRGRPKKV